jgi:hypothetical protein
MSGPDRVKSRRRYVRTINFLPRIKTLQGGDNCNRLSDGSKIIVVRSANYCVSCPPSKSCTKAPTSKRKTCLSPHFYDHLDSLREEFELLAGEFDNTKTWSLSMEATSIQFSWNSLLNPLNHGLFVHSQVADTGTRAYSTIYLSFSNSPPSLLRALPYPFSHSDSGQNEVG